MKEINNLSEREQIFIWLGSCPVRWEINFDDFEIMSVNLLYDAGDEEDESSIS